MHARHFYSFFFAGGFRLQLALFVLMDKFGHDPNRTMMRNCPVPGLEMTFRNNSMIILHSFHEEIKESASTNSNMQIPHDIIFTKTNIQPKQHPENPT